MAWTAPMTWVTGAAITAAQLNSHLRDNMLETAVAKATTAGGFSVNTGTNALAEHLLLESTVVTSETTTSTSNTDLTTTGPTVTATIASRAIVMLSGTMSNSTVNQVCLMGYEISGASTQSASAANSMRHTSSTADALISASFVDSVFLTAGSNTFTCKYAVSAGTGTFQNRRIAVLPF